MNARKMTGWILATLLAACVVEGGVVEPVPEDEPVPTTVEVTPSDVTLEVGDTEKLAAEVLDQDGNTLDVAVTWFSSDEDVATVTSSGTVEGRAGGDATITATAGDASGSAAVTVTKPETGRVIFKDDFDGDVLGVDWTAFFDTEVVVADGRVRFWSLVDGDYSAGIESTLPVTVSDWEVTVRVRREQGNEDNSRLYLAMEDDYGEKVYLDFYFPRNNLCPGRASWGLWHEETYYDNGYACVAAEVGSYFDASVRVVGDAYHVTVEGRRRVVRPGMGEPPVIPIVSMVSLGTWNETERVRIDYITVKDVSQ